MEYLEGFKLLLIGLIGGTLFPFIMKFILDKLNILKGK